MMPFIIVTEITNS